MIKKALLLVCIGMLTSGFNLPDEKKFLSRKVENIKLFDAENNQFDLLSLLGNKPLIISPVYTNCPSICSILSNGIKQAIEGTEMLGKDFNVISFSFDSTDRVKNLATYEARWNMDGKHWKTVSASYPDIMKFLTSIDYHFDLNKVTGDYDHPALLVVLTPSGRISRYIYGLNPSKRDLKLAVMEAAAEKYRPGIFKGIYLKCFSFDPLSKTYKIDWSFIISTFAGILMIGIVSSIFIKSFITK